MLGVLLIVLGLIAWLVLGAFVVGIVLIILGALLLFAPWPGVYGYGWYRGRRGPP